MTLLNNPPVADQSPALPAQPIAPTVRVRLRPTPKPAVTAEEMSSQLPSIVAAPHVAPALPPKKPAPVRDLSAAPPSSRREAVRAVNSEHDRDVEPRRTSKSTQFQPNNRANPFGRPKGAKNARTLLINALNTKIEVRENGRKKKMTKFEVGVVKFANKFVETGDPKTLLEILKILLPVEAAAASTSNDTLPLSAAASAAMLEGFVQKRIFETQVKATDSDDLIAPRPEIGNPVDG